MSEADTGDPTREPVSIDPTLYDREDVRPILAVLDIGALYRILQGAGVSQRKIAGLTGQSQSEVSDIVAGRRKVENHQLLKRITTGLGIPPERMGLSWWGPDGSWYGPEGAYPEGVPVTDPPEGVEEEVRRRAVILAAPVALWGHPLFGEVPELPAPNWLVGALPFRLEMMHVEAVAHLLAQLRAWARAWGGMAEVLGAVAVQSKRLLTVPGEDTIRARLGSVLAELHTEAGWTYFDSGDDDAADYYYCQALNIARQVGDRYQIAHALRHAGMLPLERGRFDDSLKLFQLGQITFMPLDGSSTKDDPRIAPMTACLDSLQARALARMDRPEQARSKLAAARDKWQAPDTFAQADADYRNADISLCLGQLDGAERFASLSVRAWGNQDRRPAASARILLATIHVRTGDSRSPQLAHHAITAATKLSSDRVRKRLLPLADELDARCGSDYQELARMARQVATTRV
ncbi:MAG: helix-turn-helix domain-containing protein [Pseudonocardiaceae bacterium]